MRRILLILLLGIWLAPAQAQDYAPQTGNIQVNLLLGKGMFYTNFYDLDIASSPSTLYLYPSNMEISDPNYNSIGNMLGVELKYFVTSNISVGFTGSGYISNTPARDGVQGVSTATGSIPAYNRIEAELGSRAAGSLFGHYYLSVSNERINPYVGAQFTFQYASLDRKSIRLNSSHT